MAGCFAFTEKVGVQFPVRERGSVRINDSLSEWLRRWTANP